MNNDIMLYKHGRAEEQFQLLTYSLISDRRIFMDHKSEFDIATDMFQ